MQMQLPKGSDNLTEKNSLCLFNIFQAKKMNYMIWFSSESTSIVDSCLDDKTMPNNTNSKGIIVVASYSLSLFTINA